MHPRTEYIQSGVVRRLDVLETLTYQGNVVIPTGDTTVKVSAADTTTGFLQSKIAAGSGISLAITNPGGNEQLTVTLASHTHAAGDITSGVLGTARLASSGTADSTTFLRGDQTWATPAGGVTGFTASQNTASPNNTVNASRLLVDAASTNADAVIQPKGTGALLAQLPDGTATGGNKRGANAVDLQTLRIANTQVASATRSTVIGGEHNTASGSGAVVVGGASNIASGTCSAIVGGSTNTASALGAFVAGLSNVASGEGSFTWGGELGTPPSNNNSAGYAMVGGRLCSATSGAIYAIVTGWRAVADRWGMRVHSSGTFNVAGDCQYERYVLSRATTNATQTELSCSGAAPAATTRIGIANDSTYTFSALVTARRTDADNESACWEIKGGIDNNAGTTALVGNTITTSLGDDSLGVWSVVASADNTNDALVFTVTGENAKTIRWGATVQLMKVAG